MQQNSKYTYKYTALHLRPQTHLWTTCFTAFLIIFTSSFLPLPMALRRAARVATLLLCSVAAAERSVSIGFAGRTDVVPDGYAPLLAEIQAAGEAVGLQLHFVDLEDEVGWWKGRATGGWKGKGGWSAGKCFD